MFKFISVLFVLLLSSCSFYESPRYTSYNQRGKYHYIRSGDTLWKISKKYRIDIEQLAVLNGIKNPNRLKVGKRIFIPRRSFRKLYKSSYGKKRSHPLWTKKKKNKQKIVRTRGVKFKWPVKGRVVRKYGYYKGVKFEGIIIRTKKRQTIKASAPGKVIYSSWGPGSYGKMIIVRHVGGRFHSVYANNSKNLVKLHQNVLAGTPIARAGNSRYKGKSTLRFEIRYRTVPKNPLSYLPKAY